jgi:hypothetical protein
MNIDRSRISETNTSRPERPLPCVVSINWKTGQFLMRFPWHRRGEGVFVNVKAKEAGSKHE